MFCFEYFLPGYLITTYMLPAPPVEILLRSVLAQAREQQLNSAQKQDSYQPALSKFQSLVLANDEPRPLCIYIVGEFVTSYSHRVMRPLCNYSDLPINRQQNEKILENTILVSLIFSSTNPINFVFMFFRSIFGKIFEVIFGTILETISGTISGTNFRTIFRSIWEQFQR